MFSNFKRRLGVLTAIAVMAALVPALAASPASAAPALAPAAALNGALHSACPAGSAPAGGFTDTTSTDVDCIKMHGITTGVTATTYEPASNIPRWQMALYLTRFATAGGVTLGSGADQGFTDISGYSAAIQTAINQIKQLGVTTGTTATTYSPDDNVTNEQMAMFVERMLGKTVAGPGGHDVNATYSGLIGTTSTLTYNYTDIDAGGVTFEGHNAIAEIYHLGIPGHAKTVTTFSPAAAITRADMATWMTNALAHTNARPAGVWTQVTGGNANTGFGTQTMTLHISHRDANRAAVPGTLIDIFADVTAANTDPFSASTGLCNASTNTIELGNTAGDECKVDLGDVSTDAKGNVGGSAGTGGGDVTAATTTTYWAFTAATGTSFNNLTMTANTVARSQSTAAGYVKLASTIPLNNVMDSTDATYEMVKYGTSVTLTATAKTSAVGTVVAGAFPVKVVDTVIQLADNGNAGDISNAAGDVTTTQTTTTGTMTAGVWTHTITQADPTPVGTALSSTLSRTQTTSVVTADINADGTYTAVGTILISWDDNAAGAKSATLTEGSYWGIGAGALAGGVARTATATVYDQYGSGVPNHAVVYTGACLSGTANCGESFVDNTSRTTNSVGVATLSYTDTLEASGIETTTATPSGVTAATSTYYRAVATTANHTEADASSVDGALAAATFTMPATTGIAVFNTSHGLETGEEVYLHQQPRSAAIGGHITVTALAGQWLTAGDLPGDGVAVGEQVLFTTIPLNTTFVATNTCYWVTSLTSTTSMTISATRGGPTIVTGVVSGGNGVLVKCTVPVGPYYFQKDATTPLTKGTFHPTRTYSAVTGAYTYSTKISDAVAGATNTGIARSVADAAVHDDDEFMEVVINDAANNRFIVERQSKAAEYTYHAFTYDSGDQFDIYADTVTNADLGTTAAVTAVSLAVFQAYLAAKMNAVTGVGNPSNRGDIFSITYLNANAGGGTSVFGLGS